MSQLSEKTMHELMAYCDGELDGDALERIERLLATDAHAREIVDQMGILGIAVKHIADPKDDDTQGAWSGIADAVMAKIESPGIAASIPPKRASSLSSLDEARLRKQKSRAANGVIAAGLALAAGFLMYAKTHHEAEDPSAQRPAMMAVSGESALATVEPAPTAWGHGVDVERVEAPSPDISVFNVPSTGEENSTSIVVWIGDDSKSKAPTRNGR